MRAVPVEDRRNDRQHDREDATPHGHSRFAPRAGRSFYAQPTRRRKGVSWHRSPGSDTRRSGSTRTAASASTSTRSSAARPAPTASGSPSASTRSASRTATATTPATPSGSAQKFGCPVFGMVELIGWMRGERPSRRPGGRLQQGRHDRGRGHQGHDDERLPLELGARRDVHRRARRLRLPPGGRQARLLRRRHLRVRRHAADRAASTPPTSRCSRSATTTRWGPTEAALALELLGNPRCVPCHWGTFPPLVGRPAQLAELTERPGRADLTRRHRVRCDAGRVRERWFGATGRRVPEIALDGSLDLDGALVLDSVDDEDGASRSARRRPAGRRSRRDGRRRQAGARPPRGRLGPRHRPGAARARPDGADLWLTGRPSSRPTRSPPATSRRASGASRRSRSSSPSARSSRGRSRTSGRSRPRPTRTRATGPTGWRSCARV